MEELKEGAIMEGAETLENPPEAAEVPPAPKKKSSPKRKLVEGEEKPPTKKKAPVSKAVPKEGEGAKTPVSNEISKGVFEVVPKKEGEAAIALQEVKLVLGNSIVAIAAQATVANGQWTISMGQVDKFIGMKVLMPIAEGRSPDPRYAKALMEIYLLGGVKKKLTGIGLSEFQAYPMLNGRLVVVKASGKYKGIEDAAMCPYPLINSLTEQYHPTPIPSQVSIGDPINTISMETQVVLY